MQHQEEESASRGSVLVLGLDLGSVSLNSVVLGSDNEVLWSDYTRTKGKPLPTALEVLKRIFAQFPRSDFKSCALTGSGAASLAPLLHGLAVNEIIALSRGVEGYHPQAASIIDMGGEDAKLVLTQAEPGGGLAIRDFAMNTMCAAGTGSFLDQQSHRLQLSIEEFSELALKSQNPPRLAGRCSVFAKTDMIHLQQDATPDYDIVAGLCFAMARNLKSNIAKGKKVTPPVIFTGGVAANHGVRRALLEILGLEPHELIIPEHFACLGALGAAQIAREQDYAQPIPDLAVLEDGIRADQAPDRGLPVLSWGEHHRKDLMNIEVPQGPLQGYLGVDVGSISTNVVVISQEGRLLNKQYLMTAGRPLEAVKQGLARLGAELGDRLTILGAGTTGSGRYLTADFIGADLVRNEITAQATAAAFIDPKVDTIFEIGGQDSKYISLKDGAIVDFTMNKVCAAGTGSFLEEQAEKLGISIRNEFGDRALNASCPASMGERCTVFMESDLVALQAAGQGTDDLVAGLSYSIVQNYLNKVVEDRTVGQRVFFQGAPAANRGIVAAFESVLGRPITVPPHHDVTGAMGAALLAMRERDWKQSRFKGFGVSQADYAISTFECAGCPNTCTIRKVKVEGEKRPLFYGSRCEKYDVDQSASAGGRELPDLFAQREELLTSYIEPPAKSRGVLGLPRTMIFRELLPFFAVFLRDLGFEALLSGPSNKHMIHQGVEALVNEPCFPLKVAHGHLAALMQEGVERIFLPSVVNLDSPNHPMGYGQVCPYSQTLPYTAPASLDFAGNRAELLSAPLHFGWGDERLLADLKDLARTLGAPTAGVKAAMRAGMEAQQDFYARIRRLGQEALDAMGPDDLGMVVVSRPYNGADPGINLGLPGKMTDLGVWALPMDFLDLESQMGAQNLAEMYWRYGQKILASANLIRKDPRLFGIYISNFGCGPDSFIAHFFAQIMQGKPYLEIEIDEHSADVGAVTRLEAFLDSLKNAPPVEPEPEPVKHRNLATSNRKVYVPPMSDHGHGVAAAFRACGVDAQMMPPSDSRTLELGLKYTSGKECYPCALTTGDMLKLLQDDGVKPDEVALFMPSGTGPCRFGQYHRYHRLVLDQMGFSEVPIYAPDQSEKLYSELQMVGGSDFVRFGWQGIVAVDLLLKALHETRPYEAQSGRTDAVYQHHLDKVQETIAGRGDLVAAMQAARNDFAAIERANGDRRPLVGIVGEIYTRANTFANSDVVRAVEEFGGEAWLPTVAEWVLYINFTGSRRARSMGLWKAWLGTRIKEFYQHKDERALSAPWRGYLKTLHEPGTKSILKNAAPYLSDTYEGEAVLSLGKSLDMKRRGVAGIINVIPFTCMPGTIVNAVMKRFREDHGDIPFLPLAMDGQQQAGFKVRLEAFMHQVTQRAALDLPGRAAGQSPGD
jgi:predicted CoA-substrate-specific enzyme activase